MTVGMTGDAGFWAAPNPSIGWTGQRVMVASISIVSHQRALPHTALACSAKSWRAIPEGMAGHDVPC